VTAAKMIEKTSISRVGINTVANFVGTSLTQAAGIVFAIAYFRILGSENFGLVGFSVTLVQLGSYFADMGVGRVVVRELARRSHASDLAEQMGDVLFTLQATNFALAVVVATTIAGGASWLAQHWLKLGDVPLRDAVHAIIIMGGIALLQLPRSISLEALRGLQQQVLSNILMAVFSLLRGCVTLGALYFVAPTATVFLLSQLFVAFVETAVITAAAWLSMPKSSRLPRFDTKVIRETWAFALGDGGTALIGAGMMFGDKVILSRLLPLEAFGAYVFCASLADAVGRVAMPFNSAFYPHFVDLVARKQEQKLSQDYLQVTQIVASILIPISITIAFFSKEILQLLVGKPEIVASFALVLTLRTIANMVNCLQHMPHALQLAIGLSSLALKVNLVSVCVYLPAIVILTPHFGAVVPAALWLGVNFLNSFPMVIGTHSRILKNDIWNWVYGSVARPLAITIVIVCTSRLFYPGLVAWPITLPWLAVTALASCAAAIFCSPRTRDFGLSILRFPLNRVKRAA
jgi:O-antigen/teichoic acid export membrane protein